VDGFAQRILAEEYYSELVADTEGEHYLIREVYNAVHSGELNGAKTVNITAEIEGESFTFNLDRGHIRHENRISEYYIMPAAVRREIEVALRKRREKSKEHSADLLLSDITEITYKRKVIYKREETA
jgi:hypothetical protein